MLVCVVAASGEVNGCTASMEGLSLMREGGREGERRGGEPGGLTTK